MDEGRITMVGKWWCDNDLEKQDFTFAFNDVIPAHFWFRLNSTDTYDQIMIDLKEMKIRDKTEKE